MNEDLEVVLGFAWWCVLFLFLVNATLLVSYCSVFWSIVLGCMSFSWLVFTIDVFRIVIRENEEVGKK